MKKVGDTGRTRCRHPPGFGHQPRIERAGPRRHSCARTFITAQPLCPSTCLRLTATARAIFPGWRSPSWSGSARRTRSTPRASASEAMCLMESYAWPGNVRELRNIVERLAILCDQDRIEPHHLPKQSAAPPPRSTVSQLPQTTWRNSSDSSSRFATRPLSSSNDGFSARPGALPGQRQPRRRGDRHPADESARLDRQVRG